MEFIANRDKGWGFQTANLTYDLPLEFTVLPFKWFDPQWATAHTRLSSFDAFFENTKNTYFNNFYPKSFCYHWHNRWKNKIEDHRPIRQLFNALNSLEKEKK